MKILTLALAILTAVPAMAQTLLFHTGDSTGYPYRIPAIAVPKNGDVVALSDWRPCGSDIGYGRVDIMSRVSHDNGATWSEQEAVIRGHGDGVTAGYGDACLVADRDRNELLLVCVSGHVPYWTSTVENPQHLVSLRAKLDKKSGKWLWSEKPLDHTEEIYKGIYQGRIRALFMGSGRICQSKKIKVGKYYRVYGALCTHTGNFVIYSDDFGRTWKSLGAAEVSAAPRGDEAKCEELPDGSVLLSSRKSGGRYFNIFRYTDIENGKGMWGHAVDSRTAPGGISNEGTPCNGEILLVSVRRADGTPTTLALQSIPAGPKRSNVTIYWKELDSRADYLTPLAFASNWEGSYRVTDKGSGYSTMVVQKDGRIAFFYEEEPKYYQMVYKPLSIETVTGGRYK